MEGDSPDQNSSSDYNCYGVLSSEDLAYTAGLIDGEGCITILKHKKTVYTPLVTVTMTNRSALEFLKARFGGQVYERSQSRQKWRVAYQWTVTGKRAYEMIDRISKYLITKQPQSELIFEYYSHSSTRSKGHPIPDSEKSRRESVYREMRELNKRGR